jgi:hypothetical protein
MSQTKLEIVLGVKAACLQIAKIFKDKNILRLKNNKNIYTSRNKLHVIVLG